VLLFEVDDGPPRLGAPAPIDFFDQAVNFVVEALVGAHVSTAGHSDLDKYQPLPEVRILLQEQIEGAQPFRDALGVVDAIDADADPFVAEGQLLSPAVQLALHLRAVGGSFVSLEVNTDGKRP